MNFSLQIHNFTTHTNMNHRTIAIILLLLSIIFTACTQDTDNQNKPSEAELLSETISYQESVANLSELLTDIYDEAYDGNNIDIEVYSRLISKVIPKGYDDPLDPTPFLRSNNDGSVSIDYNSCIEENFNSKEIKIYQIITNALKDDMVIDKAEERQLYSLICNSLDNQKDREEMLQVLYGIKLTGDAVVLFEQNNDLRALSSFAGKFLCNAVGMGMGHAWGLTASAIAIAAGASAAVTGGVSFVVTAAVSLAFGSAAC